MTFYSGPFREYFVAGALLEGWTVVILIVLLLLLFRSCHSIRVSTDPTKYKNKTNIFTVIAVTCFSIACICATAQMPICLLSWSDALFVNILGGVWWMMAQIMVYILLIIKLHGAFEGTKYQCPMRIYYILGVLLTVFGLSQIAKLFILVHEGMALERDGGIVPSGLHNRLLSRMAVCNGIMAVIDILLSFILVYLFCTKLVSIAVQSVRNDGNIHLHYKSRQNKEILRSFIDAVVKHTILTFTATVATQIHILYWSIKDFIVSQSDDVEEWIYTAMFENLVWPTQMIVNSICIIQYLPSTNPMYRHCHGCHAWCKLFFMQCARRRIRKEINSELHCSLLGHGSVEM